MQVSPITQTNYMTKRNSVQFGEATAPQPPAAVETSPTEQAAKDSKSAKNFAMIAGLGSVATLAVSLMALSKGKKLASQAEPVITELKSQLEKTKKITTVAEEFMKNTGMDKLFSVSGKIVSDVFKSSGEFIKNISKDIEEINKLNPEKDKVKILKLKSNLQKKTIDAITKLAKETDKNNGKEIVEIVDTPLAQITKFLATMGDSAKAFSKRASFKLEDSIEDILKTGQTGKKIQEFVKN